MATIHCSTMHSFRLRHRLEVMHHMPSTLGGLVVGILLITSASCTKDPAPAASSPPKQLSVQTAKAPEPTPEPPAPQLALQPQMPGIDPEPKTISPATNSAPNSLDSAPIITSQPSTADTLILSTSATDRTEEAAFFKAMEMLKSVSASDRSNALLRIQSAAEGGLAAAQHNWGVFHLHGRGVESNQVLAEKWLRKAADQGLAEAQFKLSVLGTSKGTMPLTETAEWLDKAARKGHFEAAYQLGVLHLRGIEGKPDPISAAKCFRIAAESGHAKSQVNLGALLFHGGAGITNRSEAIAWYRKAADQGNSAACFNLGSALAKGDGVEQDLVSGYFWLSIAARQGDRDALSLAKQTAIEMTPNQLAEGIRRVAAFDRTRSQTQTPR